MLAMDINYGPVFARNNWLVLIFAILCISRAQATLAVLGYDDVPNCAARVCEVGSPVIDRPNVGNADELWITPYWLYSNVGNHYYRATHIKYWAAVREPFKILLVEKCSGSVPNCFNIVDIFEIPAGPIDREVTYEIPGDPFLRAEFEKFDTYLGLAFNSSGAVVKHTLPGDAGGEDTLEHELALNVDLDSLTSDDFPYMVTTDDDDGSLTRLFSLKAVVRASYYNAGFIEKGNLKHYGGAIWKYGTPRTNKVFRIQEGAIVKFICPLEKAQAIDKHNNDDFFDMYWEIGGDKVGRKGDPGVDGIEVIDRIQVYKEPALDFIPTDGKRLLVMTYTARMEDNWKQVSCEIADEDSMDSQSVANQSPGVGKLTLAVLPGPAPQSYQSTIGNHVWPGGFPAEIYIPVDAYYNSWKAVLEFPKPVFSLYAANFNIAEETCLHKGACSKSKRTWIIYNTYENRVLSPMQDLTLRFAADVSKKLNRGRGRGLVADVTFYGYNKVFSSSKAPRY